MKQDFLDAARRLIHDTPIEVAIGAVIVGGAGFAVSYNINLERERSIPIAFSEIGKTIRALEKEGKTVPALTKFYSSANDAAMKIFESHNIALSTSRSHATFARELETRVDPALKIYSQLGLYSKEVPQDAKAALEVVKPLTEAARDVAPINAAFANTWDEHHRDVYKTVYYTVQVCDSDGNNCHSEERSRSEYDYTVHTYTYDAQQGTLAAKLLGEFLQKHPHIRVDEKLLLATSTDADNEYAIEKSMKKALGGKIPTPEQALMYANSWATGSNFTHYYPVAVQNRNGLQQLAPSWNAALKTARSQRYTTNRSSDDGPAEFQAAKALLARGQLLADSAHRIAGGMQMTAYAVPALEKNTREYIAVVLDKKPGDADDLREKVIGGARGIYQSNFAKGLDVQPFKWGQIWAVTVAGILAGGLIGFGADRLGEWHRTRGSRKTFPARGWPRR